MIDLNVAIAFLAGILSFLAPCVIPLFPVFLSFITGLSISELNSKNASDYTRKVILNTLLYIVGFSLMFVLLGLSATSLGRVLIESREELNRISGIFIVVFGFYMIGTFRKLTFTQKEFNITLPESIRSLKFIGPFLMGVTFALAWSPCVGAILGAILTLAARSDSVGKGGLLLFAYSLGISLPFFISALTISRSYLFMRNLSGKVRVLTVASGVLMVLFGILMLAGRFDLFSGFFLSKLNAIPWYRVFVEKL